jgi:tetratricopeptide (TPR) repeat protein
LAFNRYVTLIFGWSDDPEETLRQGIEEATKGIAIDARDYNSHFALGRLLTLKGDHDGAIRSLKSALEINPNFAQGYYGLAAAQLFQGDTGPHVVENTDKAIRLSPNDSLLWVYLIYKALGHFAAGELDQAIDSAEKSCASPFAQFLAFAWLVSFYAEAGQKENAQRTLARARALEPSLSIGYIKNILKTARGETFERLYLGLSKAGLPD